MSTVAESGFGPSPAMSAALARNWWLIALRGVLGILFGIVAFVVPGATILSLVLFFAAYMLVDGIFTIAAAIRAAQARERWSLLVLEGLANIACGVIAFLLPGLTVLVFVLLIDSLSADSRPLYILRCRSHRMGLSVPGTKPWRSSASPSTTNTT